MFSKKLSQMVLLIFCTALLALAVIALPAVRSRSKALANTGGNRVVGTSIVQAVPASPPRQLIRVWVHRDAVYPTFLRLHPGKVLLRVENQTQSDKGLVVERLLPSQAHQELARLRVVSSDLRADGELVLGAGEYIYYEESAPEFIGHLLVEPE